MDPTHWIGPTPPPSNPPAGWYPDPYQPGLWRWFDGRGWTTEVWPGGSASSPPDATGDLARERSARPWAKLGVCVLAFSGPCVALVYALALRSLFHDISNVIDQARLHPGRSPQAPFIPLRTSLEIDAVSLVSIGAEIGIMVWMYQAATVGKRLGMPMTLEPFWAIIGWLVPVVNLWFPHRLIVGTLPVGHQARRHARRWWVLFIAGSVLFGVLGVVLAFQSRSLLLVLVPLAFYSWIEARAGLAMIEGVDSVHARAVQALGHVVPPG